MCLKGVLEDYNIFIFVGKRARQVILPEGVCDRGKNKLSFTHIWIIGTMNSYFIIKIDYFYSLKRNIYLLF